MGIKGEQQKLPPLAIASNSITFIITSFTLFGGGFSFPFSFSFFNFASSCPRARFSAFVSAGGGGITGDCDGGSLVRVEEHSENEESAGLLSSACLFRLLSTLFISCWTSMGSIALGC